MAFDYSDPNVRRPMFGPGAGFGGTQATAQSANATTGGATAGGSIPQKQFADRIAAGERPGYQPPGNWTAPAQYSQYYGGGNIGQSAPGSRSPTGNPANIPADAADYPWMQDQSIQWGGGPYGYLPIGYQPQNYDYYSQGNYGGHLAPWEYKYWQDTWTQNYDPNQPGYINTRDPNAGQSRG